MSEYDALLALYGGGPLPCEFVDRAAEHEYLTRRALGTLPVVETVLESGVRDTSNVVSFAEFDLRRLLKATKKSYI